MILVTFPLVSAIDSQSNKFVTGVKIQATGDPKLSESPEFILLTLCH